MARLRQRMTVLHDRLRGKVDHIDPDDLDLIVWSLCCEPDERVFFIVPSPHHQGGYVF